MCDSGADYDPCEVYSVTEHRARIEHRCCACSAPILPGEVYGRHFMIFEGDVSAEKACALCAAVHDWFTTEHRGGLSPSSLFDMLIGCITHGEESLGYGAEHFDTVEESIRVRSAQNALEGRWRTALAVLRRRQGRARRTRRAAARDAALAEIARGGR